LRGVGNGAVKSMNLTETRSHVQIHYSLTSAFGIVVLPFVIVRYTACLSHAKGAAVWLYSKNSSYPIVNVAAFVQTVKPENSFLSVGL